MRSLAKHHAVFKRLETDAEFTARLIAAGVERHMLDGAAGERLDDWGWYWRKMQRRIVEDVS